MQALARSKSNKVTAPIPTAKQEAFSVHYATFGNAVAAYLHAYDSKTTRRASVQQAAWQTLHQPAVVARVTALRNAQASNELATRERLIADLEQMVEVDTTELMQLRVVPCPVCWPTANAWEVAAASALDAGHEPPSVDEPNPRCRPCGGAGRNVGHLTSTADLSLPARRMFKGLEFFPDGGIKRVLLHDAAQLRIELHKLKGMHVDRSVSLSLTAELKPLKRGMSVEEALEIMDEVSPVNDEDSAAADATVVSEQ